MTLSLFFAIKETIIFFKAFSEDISVFAVSWETFGGRRDGSVLTEIIGIILLPLPVDPLGKSFRRTFLFEAMLRDMTLLLLNKNINNNRITKKRHSHLSLVDCSTLSVFST